MTNIFLTEDELDITLKTTLRPQGEDDFPQEIYHHYVRSPAINYFHYTKLLYTCTKYLQILFQRETYCTSKWITDIASEFRMYGTDELYHLRQKLQCLTH